jgi:3-deoxy-D-manno-octulosonic-acid transferase
LTAILRLYRSAGWTLTPLLRLYLEARARAGKENKTRLAERTGHAAIPRPKGALVWLHAASVGEALSALPLLHRIATTHPRLHMLLTTGTVTSAQVVAGQLPSNCVHQFVPVDLAPAVRRFFDHWRPDLAVLIESEFWPGILSELREREIPAVLLQGRLSEASLRRWLCFPKLAARLLQTFDFALAQSAADGERLQRLGARDVECLGNLKMAAAPLPADANELATLAAALEGRPRWLAASTHPGEEEIIANVHRDIAGRYPGLLTIVAPRHPARGPELARRLRAQGLAVGLRSEGGLPGGGVPGPDIHLYIADRLGELGLWFRLCDVVFMGGSLVAHGGQNPLEAARLGCAILYGPHTRNFAEINAGLEAMSGGRRVANEAELSVVVRQLLFTDAAWRSRMQGAARRFVADGDAVLDRIHRRLSPLLDRLGKKKPRLPG